MVDLGEFKFLAAQKKSWKRGPLREHWAMAYPHLFDADDIRQSRTQGPKGYHFIEWLGAITLHHLTGYHALVSKYEFANHARKKEVIRTLLSPEAVAFMRARTARRITQCPDLLMYAPDFSDCFFCEVKGPGDRLRPSQQSFFKELNWLTGKTVYVLRFRQVERL